MREQRARQTGDNYDHLVYKLGSDMVWLIGPAGLYLKTAAGLRVGGARGFAMGLFLQKPLDRNLVFLYFLSQVRVDCRLLQTEPPLAPPLAPHLAPTRLPNVH
jgi:hypothetical protein